jgi:hypothetical protein
MFRTPILWMFLGGLGLSGAPLRAEPRMHSKASAIEFSEDGLPIIKVVLHALKHPSRTRSCRFLVSTGFENTIIDQSIPTEFYWDENGTASFQDATGTPHTLTAVLVKRLEVAGLVRDGVTGARADLKRAGSPDQDDPVDGILGMSFLRGTRFVYDPEGRRIHWGLAPAPGVTLPLIYTANHLPLATLRVGSTQVTALLDLGRMGGLDLPWRLKPAGKGQLIYSQGMLGNAAPGQHQEVGRVEAGAGAWTDIPVAFQEGVEVGGIGQDVWSAAPAGFDFIQDRLTLQLDKAGRLPIRAQPRLTLPVLWDRTGPSPRLVVAAVKPGSPMAKAGCQPGDVLIRAGNLSGRALSRRTLMALMARGEAHIWIVRREGKPEKLLLFGPPQK